MIGKRVQAVKDKTRCDHCNHTGQQVAEHRFDLKFVADYTCGCPHDGRRSPGCKAVHRKRHETVTHWIDLCPSCGAKDCPQEGGFLVGIHANVQPRTKAHRGRADRNARYS